MFEVMLFVAVLAGLTASFAKAGSSGVEEDVHAGLPEQPDGDVQTEDDEIGYEPEKGDDDDDREPEAKYDPADESEDEGDEDEEESDEVAATEGGDEVEAEKEAETEPQGIQFDDELKGFARELNVSLDQFDSVSAAEEHLMKIVDARQKAAQPAQPFKVGLDPEEHDENVIGEFKRVGQHVDQTTSQLLNRIAALENRIKTHDDIVYTARFDTLTAARPQYAHLLGEGATDSMSKSSAEYKARTQLDDKIQFLATAYKYNGGPPPDFATIYDEAARLVFGDRLQEIARKEVEAKKEKAEKRAVARAKTRKPAGEKPGPAKAARTAEREGRRLKVWKD